MPRLKNVDWTLSDTPSWDRTHTALLMDIRDELQTLNRLLACRNFLGIPASLRRIDANTKKPVRKRRAK